MAITIPNHKQCALALMALLGSVSSMAVEHISPLPQQHWFASSETQGVQVLDKNLTSLSHYPGRYAQTATRQVQNNKQLLVAINETLNTLDVFSWDGKRLILKDRQAEAQQSLNGVCLYQDPVNQDVHAFLLKEHGAVEQRIIYHAEQNRITHRSVRNLPVPDDIAACAVDDQTQTLYLAEGQIGVWSMSAHPEHDLSRMPVLMRAPYGPLPDELETLHILADGTLAIPQTDSEQVFFHHPDTKASSSAKTNPRKVKGLQEAVAMQYSSDKKLHLVTGKDIAKLNNSIVSRKAVNREKADYFMQIPAAAQTTPVQKSGDAADDPAIWYNAEHPEASLILGTDKKLGLAVYNLDGAELQFLEVGRVNNVDLRDNFEYQGKNYTLASASQRDHNSIALFLIDPQTSQVSFVGETPTTFDSVYGLCMYYGDGKHYVFINDKDGRYQQYHINNDLQGKLVRELTLPDQPEGCVANDDTHDLFLGVEELGVWHTSAKAEHKTAPKEIISVGGPLAADVEGMSLYIRDDKQYLVVSSQGNNSYALYQANAPYEYISSIEVSADLHNGVDGSSETDGLDVSGANFGGRFSEGLLVVQDGRNVMPAQTQNFKLVAFGDILKGLTDAGIKH